MDWKQSYLPENEQPLDRLVDGYSNTAIFRTIGFIGDSLSSGEFESRNAQGQNGYHDYFEYSWGQYIARANGLTARNFSRGGMTAKEYMETFADDNRFWDPAQACQAYVIALGVNDIFGLNMEIGSVADIDSQDYRNNRPTFAGYYAMIVSRLKEIQPRAKFFFVTIPRENAAHDEKVLPMVRLLYDLADYFDNAYVIDLFRYAPVYDEAFHKHFFLYGHMNAQGYLLTARMIDSYIDYIIRHNPEDFALVPYIGTDLS